MWVVISIVALLAIFALARVLRRPIGFEIETEIGDAGYAGVGILTLTGVSEVEGGHEGLEQAVARLLSGGCMSLVIDCERLRWITADALGVVLQELHRLRSAGGDIAFVAIRGDVRDFLEQTGLGKKLRTFPSVDEAVEKLAGEVKKGASLPKARCSIDTETAGETLIVVVRGGLDAEGASRLETKVSEGLARPKARVLVDGTALVTLSSSALAALVKLAGRAAEADGSLAVVATGLPRAILDALGLAAVLSVHATRAEALAAPVK